MKAASKLKILSFEPRTQASITEQRKVHRADFLLTADDMDLMTKQEVANFLKVTVAAISRWITEGRLLPTKLGRLTRISRAEIERFVLAENARLQKRALALIADYKRLQRLRERARQYCLRNADDQNVCEV